MWHVRCVLAWQIPEQRLGSVIAEKYRLERVLGSGGMGVVFAGRHLWTQRLVAVKLLKPQPEHSPQLVSRFLREARAATRVDHPHVAEVLDMGEDRGEVYLVLELLKGEPLSRYLDRERTLSLTHMLPVLAPIVDAVHSVHQCGIVHRDIKPENIFLSVNRTGKTVPKLLDFGIAKYMRGMATADNRTSQQTGGAIGTPWYMSPEQARACPDIDPRSDVWSLGVVMYQCLSGTVPFDADDSAEVLAAILRDEPTPLVRVVPEVGAGVSDVVRTALDKDPSGRPSSVRALFRAVAQAAGAERFEFGTSLPIHIAVELESDVPDLLETQSATTAGGAKKRSVPVPASANSEKLDNTDKRGKAPRASRRGLIAAAAILAIAGTAFTYWLGVQGEPDENIKAEPSESALVTQARAATPVRNFGSNSGTDPTEHSSRNPDPQSLEREPKPKQKPKKEHSAHATSRKTDERSASPQRRGSVQPSKDPAPRDSSERRGTNDALIILD